MPETIEDIEREIAELKGKIALIEAIPAAARSADDKAFLLSYNQQLAELRKEKNALRETNQGNALILSAYLYRIFIICNERFPHTLAQQFQHHQRQFLQVSILLLMWQFAFLYSLYCPCF